MESGEFKINQMQSAEIERKIKDGGGLQKFQPMNYQGSLRQFTHEILEQLENGFELDTDTMKKIMTDQMIVR